MQFVRQIAGTFVVRIGTIGLAFISTIIVARALGPERRGVFAEISVFAALCIQFGTLGLHSSNTYYVARDRRLLSSALGNSILVSLAVGGICALATFAVSQMAPGILPAQGALLALSVAAVPIGLMLIFGQNLLLSIQNVKTYNVLELLNRGLSVVIILAMFTGGIQNVAAYYSAALIAGIVVAFIATIVLTRNIPQSPQPSLHLLRTGMGYSGKAYIACLLAFLVLKLDILLVGAMLGSTDVGYYAIAVTIADLYFTGPTVVCSLMFPKLTAISDPAERLATTRGVTWVLVPILVVSNFGVILLALPAVEWMFGGSYLPAVPALLWLLPGLTLMSINMVYMQYFAACGMPWISVVSPLIATIVNIALNVLLIPTMGIEGAAIASSISYGLMLVMSCGYILSTQRTILRQSYRLEGAEQMDLGVPENIYGHRKRLEWFVPQLRRNDRVVELGCGTGYMITRALLRLGYDAYGVDIDKQSIEYGQKLFRQEQLDDSRLKAIDLRDLEFQADVIIASEVLEHIPDGDMSGVFEAIRKALKPGGRLLVTVPNGYGWFEFEALLWNKFGLRHCFFWWSRYVALKKRIFGEHRFDETPMTVAESPHVQRFTWNSIRSLLESEGFRVEQTEGSVLFAGPPSHVFFTGIPWIMSANRALGRMFKPVATGFYLSCVDTRASELADAA